MRQSDSHAGFRSASRRTTYTVSQTHNFIPRNSDCTRSDSELTKSHVDALRPSEIRERTCLSSNVGSNVLRCRSAFLGSPLILTNGSSSIVWRRSQQNHLKQQVSELHLDIQIVHQRGPLAYPAAVARLTIVQTVGQSDVRPHAKDLRIRKLSFFTDSCGWLIGAWQDDLPRHHRRTKNARWFSWMVPT